MKNKIRELLLTAITLSSAQATDTPNSLQPSSGLEKSSTTVERGICYNTKEHSSPTTTPFFPPYEHQFVKNAFQTIRDALNGGKIKSISRPDGKFVFKFEETHINGTTFLDISERPFFDLTAANNFTYRCELATFELHSRAKGNAVDLRTLLSRCENPKLTFSKTPFSNKMLYVVEARPISIEAEFDCQIPGNETPVHIRWTGILQENRQAVHLGEKT